VVASSPTKRIPGLGPTVVWALSQVSHLAMASVSVTWSEDPTPLVTWLVGPSVEEATSKVEFWSDVLPLVACPLLWIPTGRLCFHSHLYDVLNRASLCRNGSSPAPSHQRSLTSNRSTSVVSVHSTSSTYDSRLCDSDVPPSTAETEELKKRLQRSVAETEGMKIELQLKKEEISELRDKVMSLTRELAEVSTTKGALNEVRTQLSSLMYKFCFL